MQSDISRSTSTPLLDIQHDIQHADGTGVRFYFDLKLVSHDSYLTGGFLGRPTMFIRVLQSRKSRIRWDSAMGFCEKICASFDPDCREDPDLFVARKAYQIMGYQHDPFDSLPLCRVILTRELKDAHPEGLIEETPGMYVLVLALLTTIDRDWVERRKYSPEVVDRVNRVSALLGRRGYWWEGGAQALSPMAYAREMDDIEEDDLEEDYATTDASSEDGCMS